jgi:uncharacterized protein involved in response to NO
VSHPSVTLHEKGAAASSAGLTPFAYGFRPFFLLAIAYALVSIIFWMVMRATGAIPVATLPPQFWHGHEMLFGFIGAAIAGFLLTAVPSWTGARGFAGWPLILLTLLWLAGRLAFCFAEDLPLWAVATAELAFLPALAFMIAVPLLRARNRNTPLLLVLGALWFADASFMWTMARGDVALASSALYAGIDIVLLLITVIGGRIVPAFTANALKKRGVAADVRNRKWVDAVAIAAMVALIALDAFAPGQQDAIAAVAGLAAILHTIRLAGWRGLHTLQEPIVWVLHLAYAWLPAGLALRAIHAAAGADWAALWLHALTIGAASTMIVAVITRASLGHTGRPLVVSKPIAVAYVLIAAAALVRVFGPAIANAREWTIGIAAVLWTAAFVIILTIYGPILLRPRVDGRAG